MRLFDITLKDLKQILRDKRSLLFLILMPIFFTLFMGLAYRGQQEDPNADNRLVLAVVDKDNGASLGKHLIASIDKSEAIRLEYLDEPAAREAVRKEKAGGVLVIPAGFSQSRLTDGTAQLVLITDQTTPTGQSIYQAVSVSLTQLMSAVEIAYLDVSSITAQKMLSESEESDEFDAALQAALQKWEATDNDVLVETQLAVAEEADTPFGDNPYNQASPGILLMFAIFGLNVSGQTLLQERKLRTLERMLTTSVSAAQAVGGHFLAMFTLTMVQQLVLLVFGQFVLGVDYLRAPLGVLAVAAALSFCTASMGLFLSVFSRDEGQVVLFSLIAMFIFSALGGAWFPLEIAGKAYATVGKLTPAAWAMTGFQNILIRGLSSASAILPVAILLAYAAGFFALAAWRLRKIL